jgi:protein gp37
MADSKIEWTDATWNPVAGCTIITAGCSNCYAMRMAARLEAMGVEKYRGLTRRSGGRPVWTGRIRTDEAALDAPRAWRGCRLVFVNSMSDLFHPDVPVEFVARVWKVMAETGQHTYQILTKRPEHMADVLSGGEFAVLPNVWLGTSVESADVLHRLDHLRRTPAAIRFVSFEPLLGSVKGADLTGIDWAIVGGESGPKARAIAETWVEEIEALCRAHDAAFFFKQWGGPNKQRTGRHFRGRTWDEMPARRM